MYYVIKILGWMDKYRLLVLGALFGALVLFGIVNLLYDPYRKQNRKFVLCTRSMRAFPDKTALYVTGLTEEYRRQWRAFVNCGTDKPALVFEFAPLHKRVLALWLLVGTSVVTSLYLAVFVMIRHSYVYVVLQVVFWLMFALFLIADKLVAKRRQRRARKIFAQFVTQLSACTPKSHATLAEDTVKALNKLNRAEVTDATVGQASEILRSKGLAENRTVDEQRRINLALNGLLQAYAKNARQTNS